MLVSASDDLVLGALPIAEVVAFERFVEILVGLLGDLGPAIEAAQLDRGLVLGSLPAQAIDAAVLAVAPELARAAGIGAPVADVHGAVRPEHHLARAKERIVGTQQFKLVRDV